MGHLPGRGTCSLASWQHAASFCSAAHLLSMPVCSVLLLQSALLRGMRRRMPKSWRRLGPPPCMRTSLGPDSVSFAGMGCQSVVPMRLVSMLAGGHTF